MEKDTIINLGILLSEYAEKPKDKNIYIDEVHAFLDTLDFYYIPKIKVKEIIQKYYDIYEKEKEYRYTGDVEEEQYILREIEKELLQERN